jgi:hypothetical protein
MVDWQPLRGKEFTDPQVRAVLERLAKRIIQIVDAQFAESLQQIGFLCYARFDDDYERGRISELRKLLRDEVRFYSGEHEFDIFQDQLHIAWGEDWQQKLDQSLQTALFMIPILTPAFFRSAECRNELQKFLAREQALGRSDLIIPIYYLNYPPLNGDEHTDDPLVQAMQERQWFDWRSLRYERLGSPANQRMFEQMGRQIAQAMWLLQEELPPLPLPALPEEVRTPQYQTMAELTQSQPMGFLCYDELDDLYDQGRLSELREHLRDAVRFLTGSAAFDIFQDRAHIGMGEDWQPKIEQALQTATALILILTPSFFRSEECRDQLSKFLSREQELGRRDLIVPIYYLDYPPLNGEEPSDDPLMQAIKERLWFDWRDLPHRPPEDSTVRRKIEQVAEYIAQASMS